MTEKLILELILDFVSDYLQSDTKNIIHMAKLQ